MSLKFHIVNNREWLLIKSGALGKRLLIFSLSIFSLASPVFAAQLNDVYYC